MHCVSLQSMSLINMHYILPNSDSYLIQLTTLLSIIVFPHQTSCPESSFKLRKGGAPKQEVASRSLKEEYGTPKEDHMLPLDYSPWYCSCHQSSPKDFRTPAPRNQSYSDRKA